MIVGFACEQSPGERRVALTPGAALSLIRAGHEVCFERGAGLPAGFDDAAYAAQGAVALSRTEVLDRAELICCVRVAAGEGWKPQHTAIGMADPFGSPENIQALARTGVRCFALELLPRITRAQAMDALSSQATVAGYRAALLAAAQATRMLPMMMTAAGTIPAGKSLVIGAGVAGLQALATLRRLGAIVTAYDVRPSVREQIESLGGRFLDLNLDASGAEGAGGYAAAMTEAFYQQQRSALARSVAESDIVVATAAVPGKSPPLLITAEAVGMMKPGSVIVDLAARAGSAGGNCELTQPDREIATENGVTILGPTNLPATLPHTASQLYAKNIATFVTHLLKDQKDGTLVLNMAEEITAQTLLTENGQLVNERVKGATNEFTQRRGDAKAQNG